MVTIVILGTLLPMTSAQADAIANDWNIVGNVADLATLFATILAILGLLTAWLSRPRLTVAANAMSPDALMIRVAHSKGSNSARNLNLSWGGLNADGRAMFGDGSSLWGPVFVAGDSGSITFYDPAGMSWGSPPEPHEIRIEVKKPHGLVVSVSWQRPVLSWLRTQRVVLWTVTERAAGTQPRVLEGARAWSQFRKAMKVPA
jgi:hypothetical protein